jgi:hypothetical protein
MYPNGWDVDRPLVVECGARMASIVRGTRASVFCAPGRVHVHWNTFNQRRDHHADDWTTNAAASDRERAEPNGIL